MAKDYVLGTGIDELSRLGIQHRIWADAAVAAWKRAGIGPGSKVVDLGCGPGHATFDLAQLITDQGKLIAVDASENFVKSLNEQAKARNLSQLESRIADAQNLSATFESGELFDAVYCRWVLCWLAQPEKALEGIFKILKPGGRLIIHDYFNWKTMTSAPRSAAVEKMVMAAVKSFEDNKGDVDLAARLPAMLREASFKLQHFDCHQRIARGGGTDSTLAWILTWWRTYGPKLVDLGRLDAATYEAAAADLSDLEKNPDRFFFCPPVFEFIATK